LEKGKRADFVILDKNPLEINLKELSSINVIDMYLGGKKFKQNQGLASLLYRGITRRSKKI
jgi:predicted amidohydrolase YtcJ